MRKVSFRKVDVEGSNIFYREGGPKDAQALLLLHGFPSAGHMFRDLISQLSGNAPLSQHSNARTIRRRCSEHESRHVLHAGMFHMRGSA